VVSIIHAAYAEYAGRLDPPSGAHRETVASVAAKLARGGIALAEIDGVAVGSVIYRPQAESMYLGRLAVLPAWRRRGVGRLLMAYVEEQARAAGLPRVELGVRVALPQNATYYQRLGYTVLYAGCHEGYDRTTYLQLAKDV